MENKNELQERVRVREMIEKVRIIADKSNNEDDFEVLWNLCAWLRCSFELIEDLGLNADFEEKLVEFYKMVENDIEKWLLRGGWQNEGNKRNEREMEEGIQK